MQHMTNPKMTPAAVRAALAGDVANFLTASTPGGIEAQEAAGQAMLVANAEIPKRVRGATREQMTALGFRFGVDVDDLFVKCDLPAGWTKRATSHSMHSDLLDDKGRRRAGIFYKAAFYDRNADMTFATRYNYTAHHGDDYQREQACVVTDQGQVIHTVGVWSPEKKEWPKSDELVAAAKAWLAERFPQHNDPLAYWD